MQTTTLYAICLLIFMTMQHIYSEPVTFPITIQHTAGIRTNAQPTTETKHNNIIRSLQSTTATATIGGCYNTDFTIQATIGQNQGPFNLIIDTGSTTLGVVGSACPTGTSTASCYGANPTYTPSGVSSGSINADYGSGGWQGSVYTDTVSIAGTTGVSMNFGVITTNYATQSDGTDSGQFFNPGSSGNCVATSSSQPPATQGIIGLAYPALAEQNTDSWFDKYVALTGAQNVFSINVLQQTMTIGGIGTSSNASQITYIDIDTSSTTGRGYYTVYATDLSIGTSSIGASAASFPQGTIIDSGTNSIVLPTSIYNTIANNIANLAWFQQNFNNPDFFNPNATDNCISQCDTNGNNCITEALINANLPTLGVTFTDGSGANAQTIYIQPAPGYIFPVAATQNGQAIQAWCSGISPSSSGYSILGLPYMSQFETIFNRQTSTVGFLPVSCPTCQTGNPSTSSSSVSYVTIIIAVVASVVGCLLLGYVIYRCFFMRRKNQQRNVEIRYMSGPGYVLGAASAQIPVGRPVNPNQAAANAAAARAQEQRTQQQIQYPPNISAPAAQVLWRTYYTPQNEPYYYNTETGETVWELPSGARPVAVR